jgi:PTH2 family peptidyl-tRNA hydrolase
MEDGMKQVIIVRKDLKISAGKMCSQTAHASMAFLSNMIQNNTVAEKTNTYSAYENAFGTMCVKTYRHPDLMRMSSEAFARGDKVFYARPKNPDDPWAGFVECEPSVQYRCKMLIDNDLYEKWLGGIFTKVVCEAKNRNALDKAIRIANELGLREGEDYFLIKDCCLTELTPEEYDKNGVGRTLTCIGFRPLPRDIADKISKKFQLYK